MIVTLSWLIEGILLHLLSDSDIISTSPSVLNRISLSFYSSLYSVFVYLRSLWFIRSLEGNFRMLEIPLTRTLPRSSLHEKEKETRQGPEAEKVASEIAAMWLRRVSYCVCDARRGPRGCLVCAPVIGT